MSHAESSGVRTSPTDCCISAQSGALSNCAEASRGREEGVTGLPVQASLLIQKEMTEWNYVIAIYRGLLKDRFLHFDTIAAGHERIVQSTKPA